MKDSQFIRNNKCAERDHVDQMLKLNLIENQVSMAFYKFSKRFYMFCGKIVSGYLFVLK
jgi:hypothetical protein